MKKVFNLSVLTLVLFFFSAKVEAMNFEEAFSQADRTPMVVLVYAQWANNYLNYIQQFRQSQSNLDTKFNFVELDIASKDARAFNERYHIYPKLPYILMYRDGGKVSRYIPRDCASNASCINSKLRSFIQ